MDNSSRPKYLPGQFLTEFPGPAWNELMDMLEWYRRTIPFQRDAKQEPPRYRPCSTVLVKNDTGTNLDRGAIVSFDGCEYDPAEEDQIDLFRATPIFSAGTPAFPGDIGRFAVLLQPLETEAIGHAAISGEVWCKVYMDKQGRPFADIDPDGFSPTDRLTGLEYGGAEILYIEGQDDAAEDWEYGEKHALVRIGDFNQPNHVVSWDDDLVFGVQKTAYIHDASGPTARTIPLWGSILGSGSGPLACSSPPQMNWAHFHRYSGLWELGANAFMMVPPPP